MDIPPILIPALRDLVHELVVGNVVLLEQDGRIGRLTGAEVQQAISDYGRTLTDLTDQALEDSASYPLSGQNQSWRIDLTLCTAEEGVSDLTLSLTARITEEGVHIALDDLHVL